MTLISVIIPVYNGADTLAACLTGLQQQTQPPDEILVVDDGSTDETVAVAGQFDITLLQQKNAGPGAARNYGAEVAKGDLLLFTDADCVPSPDWVARMMSPFSDPTVAGAKGEYRSGQPELVARFVQQEYQDRCDRMLDQPEIDFVDTYSAAYRRSIFLETGGFDPTFIKNQDQEFSFRLTEQGHRLVFVPGAIVYHQHDRTLGEYMRRKYLIGYWKALVTRRHPTKLVRDSHTPQVLKAQMGLALFGGGLLVSGGVLGHRLAQRGGWWLWGLLLLSSLSFYAKILRRDPAVLLIAPLLIFVRAWALSLGFLSGTLQFRVLGHYENA